jgi:hypothetical protein
LSLAETQLHICGEEDVPHNAGISEGYYQWKKRPESKRTKDNQVLLDEIKQAYQKGRKVYGSPPAFPPLEKGVGGFSLAAPFLAPEHCNPLAPVGKGGMPWA